MFMMPGMIVDVCAVVNQENVVGDPEAAKMGLGYLNDFMTIHSGNTMTKHRTITTALRVIMGDSRKLQNNAYPVQLTARAP